MSVAISSHINDPQIRELLHERDQENAALKGEILVLKEQLAWFKRQMFGVKSERIVADLDTQPLLPELDFTPLGATAEPVKEEISYKRTKPSRDRGSSAMSFPENLPVERIELDLPAEEKICPETGQPLVRIGEEVSRKLARKAEQYFVKEYVRPKYASKAFPEAGVKCASLPDAVIQRCPADESLLAFVLSSKFADHLPLYRLEEILRRSRIKISRQTLSNWVLTLGSALSPIYDAMKERVLGSGVIFADETPIDLLVRGKGRCQQAYMWIYVGGGGGDPPYRFFEFSLNRDHEHSLKLLKCYAGALHSDKYGAYEKLAKKQGVVWCPCMAHVRRKFVEAEGGDPDLRRKILRKIRYLFMLERVAWARSSEERLRVSDKRTPSCSGIKSLA